MEKKVCKLTKDIFDWILEVDNQRITFGGDHNVPYFKNHYKELGYEIIMDTDSWKKNR